MPLFRGDLKYFTAGMSLISYDSKRIYSSSRRPIFVIDGNTTPFTRLRTGFLKPLEANRRVAGQLFARIITPRGLIHFRERDA
jgi:hypothetical protein